MKKGQNKGNFVLKNNEGWRFLSGLGVIIGLLFLGVHAQATHFRHGHLVWSTTGTNFVEFTFTASFRRDGYEGSGEDGYPIRGDVIEETIGDTSLCFGDGECTDTLFFTVTSFSKGENWIMGVGGIRPGDKTIKHFYSEYGRFVAYSKSYCRISDILSLNAHINNPAGDYRLETVVLLSAL